MIPAGRLLLLGMLAPACLVALAAGRVPEEEFSLQKIWEANRTAIVRIEVHGKDAANADARVRQGTGVIVRDSGTILTALHVVGLKSEWNKKQDETLDRRIELTRLDQNQFEQTFGTAQVTEVPEYDIAILDTYGVRLGDKIFRETSTGLDTRVAALPWTPGAHVPTPQEVKLTLTDKQRHGDRLTIQMSSVLDGHSGSPIFDGAGRLVAIITNKLDGQTALAVPAYLIASRFPPGARTAKCSFSIQFGEKISLHSC